MVVAVVNMRVKLSFVNAHLRNFICLMKFLRWALTNDSSTPCSRPPPPHQTEPLINEGPCNPMSSEDSPKEDLPFHVIIEILARLPIESIFRFRCVCKSWHRLPLEKHFILLYSAVWPKKLTTLLHIVDYRRDSEVFFDVDEFGGYSRRSFDFFQFGVKVLDSCNGILLCRNPKEHSLYVCNPITREFRFLPRPTETNFRMTFVQRLTFDQYSWRFRVFIAGCHGRRWSKCFTCMVFCSTTNSWSKFDSSPYETGLIAGFNGHVFCNNSMYLLKRKDNSMYVLVLDLSAQVWRKILLPGILKKWNLRAKTCLLEFEGAPCLIHILEARMDIWVMKDYVTSNWVLIDSVSLRPILKFGSDFHPVSANGNFVILSHKRYILAYGMKNKVWRNILAIKEGVDLKCASWEVCPFRKTLFPCFEGL